MTDKKTKQPTTLNISFGEALERFAQTDPKELEKIYGDMKRAEEENRKFIADREASIKSGARTARKRFHL